MPSPVPTQRGALLTIFTPPPGCFDNPPDTWSSCQVCTVCESRSSSTTPITWECLLPVSNSCYPRGDLIEYITHTNGIESGQSVPYLLQYSPGILPSGFTTGSTYTYTISPSPDTVSFAAGCVDGWTLNADGFCASLVTGQYVGSSGLTSGPFSAHMPQIRASWQSTDLPYFTPRSAPILPSYLITRYEASVAASRSMASATTSNPKGIPTGPKKQNGLSIGAKIGIGVGVGVGVLILLGFLLFLLRRRYKKRARAESSQREVGTRYEPDAQMSQKGGRSGGEPDLQTSYSPPASPDTQMSQKGGRYGDKSDIQTSYSPPSSPPVPLASKPRDMGRSSRHELQGDFHGSEVWGARSPTLVDSRELDA